MKTPAYGTGMVFFDNSDDLGVKEIKTIAVRLKSEVVSPDKKATSPLEKSLLTND